MGRLVLTASDAAKIKAQGRRATKTTPVYIVERPDYDEVIVETPEGEMECVKGGHLIADADGTQCWPVMPGYVEANYQFSPEPETRGGP